MEKMTEIEKPKLIHIARILSKNGHARYLFLRKKSTNTFTWYEGDLQGSETETSVSASELEEALRLAPLHWKDRSFRTIICGFRYTLPERDEHGMNALFYQMAASYETMTGVYFDDELGHNCIVQRASDEARDLYRNLKQKKNC